MSTASATMPLSTRFLRFALVGAFGTAAHYAVLTALVEIIGSPVVLATTLGFVVGALVNYRLNRRYTFASTQRHAVALPKFLAIAAVGAVLNTSLVAWMLHHVPLHYLVIQLIVTGTVLVWNFAANALWTFRQ